MYDPRQYGLDGIFQKRSFMWNLSLVLKTRCIYVCVGIKKEKAHKKGKSLLQSRHRPSGGREQRGGKKEFQRPFASKPPPGLRRRDHGVLFFVIVVVLFFSIGVRGVRRDRIWWCKSRENVTGNVWNKKATLFSTQKKKDRKECTFDDILNMLTHTLLLCYIRGITRYTRKKRHETSTKA